MSGITPVSGFPYPDPTDPLADGADAIRALAERLDARVLPFDIQIAEIVSITGATGGHGPLAYARPFGAKPGMSMLSADVTAFDGSFAMYPPQTDATQFTFNTYRANGTQTLSGEPVRFTMIAIGAWAAAVATQQPAPGAAVQLQPYPLITGPNGEALTAEEADAIMRGARG